MRLSSRNKEYIDCAARYGFTCTAVALKGSSILVEVIAPSGKQFQTRMPGSPSHRNGPRNWVQNLRRLEAK